MRILINDWNMLDLYQLNDAVNLKNTGNWGILVKEIELETIGRNGVSNLLHCFASLFEKVTDSRSVTKLFRLNLRQIFDLFMLFVLI